MGVAFFHRDRRRDPSGVQPPFSKKEDTLMSKKHEVNIMIKKSDGGRESVVRTRKCRMRELLIRMLFGDAREIFVLSPGESVETVALREIKGD